MISRIPVSKTSLLVLCVFAVSIPAIWAGVNLFTVDPMPHTEVPSDSTHQAPIEPKKIENPDGREVEEFVGVPESTHKPYLKFQDCVVAGNRLSVLIEAGTSIEKFHHGPSRVENLRYYLLAIEVADGEVTSREVTGPVIAFSGSMSAFTNETGLTFTEQDREDLAQKPRLFLTDTGQLRKSSSFDKDTKEEQWELHLGTGNAKWKKVGIWNRLPLLSQASPKVLATQSAHYVVQREEDGVVRVYDLYAGKQIDDEWLEASFADLLARQDLERCVTRLTDDLKFLVVFPSRGKFTIDENVYEATSHSVLYSRPETEPSTFPLVQPEIGWMRPVSTGNKLLLIDDQEIYDPIKWSNPKSVLRIYDTDGKLVRALEVGSQLRWLRHHSCSYFWEPKAASIVCVGLPRIANGGHPKDKIKEDSRICFFEWNCESDRTGEFVIETTDLFDKRENGYYPKISVPVEK